MSENFCTFASNKQTQTKMKHSLLYPVRAPIALPGTIPKGNHKYLLYEQ
jgi:hypothetical protein